MVVRGRIAGVSIDPRSCWGRYVSEDSDTGACQVCVELCPGVFEKPVPNECARVRPEAEFERYSDLIAQAVRRCPVNGIRITPAGRARKSRRLEVTIGG